LLTFVGQSQTATLSFILAGAILGFLIFNFHPAKLFMGDSGSHFLGFALATLAIISGGKIATAALVLGVPLIDFFWSSWRRMREGRSPFAGDLEHLHHRLLKMGLAQGQVVMIFVVLSALFGVLGLLGGTWFKIAAFLGLIMLVVLIMSLIGRRRHFRA
jgi:UDP-N-acetylmuramyl pentapeptide phosphotransferase/UDP-N-acetylglucosamine-1-phosphate transferase